MITNIYEHIFNHTEKKINGKGLSKLLNKKKYIFILDVESDGLWGKGFCVSAIVIHIATGDIIEIFTQMIDNPNIENKWVLENVMPYLSDIKTVTNLFTLQENFWSLWDKYRKHSITFADSGQPVESNWFKSCVLNDMENREYLAPFPLHEVASVVLVSGIGKVNRIEYSHLGDVYRHNPFYDSLASAITLIKAFVEIHHDLILE